MSTDKAPLGIFAGGGRLPARLIEACRAQSRQVFVIALDGHADAPEIEQVPHRKLRLGAVGAMLETLRKAGCRELVLAGAVRRPSWASLRPDLRGAAFLAKIGLKALGDDGLLKRVAQELEQEGFNLLGAHQVAPDLLSVEGPIGAYFPDEQAKIDIQRATAVAKLLGAADVGQGCVVQQGMVLALEAIEGTDAMIARAGELKRRGPGGVLVKTAKPDQEMRIDLPTVGTRTVEVAKKAGLRGIAVEAGAALIVDRDEVARAADKAGLFVVGIPRQKDRQS